MDSTPNLEQVQQSQAQKEVTVNALIDALSPASAYGRHAEACDGLTWGYYGCRFGSAGVVANGTSTVSASTTTYVTVDVTTGAISFDTANTKWNDATGYGRVYRLISGAESITSYEDHRFGPGGIMSKSFAASTTPVADIPQNSQSADYTLALSDAGGHVLHPGSDATARTVTIPGNATVAFLVGAAVTFVNGHGAGALSIAIGGGDTMRLAGAGTAGTRTLAADGIATALKIGATEWIISGTGLT